MSALWSAGGVLTARILGLHRPTAHIPFSVLAAALDATHIRGCRCPALANLGTISYSPPYKTYGFKSFGAAITSCVCDRRKHEALAESAGRADA